MSNIHQRSDGLFIMNLFIKVHFYYYVLMSPMIYTISSVSTSTKKKEHWTSSFPFLHDCSNAIKSNIWKVRSNIWKDWKSANGLTKNDFKNYAKNFRRNNQQTSSDEFMPRREVRRRTTREYVNPHFDFRNYKNHTDLLFILFSSLNFLHSGPFYNHCRCVVIKYY